MTWRTSRSLRRPSCRLSQSCSRSHRRHRQQRSTPHRCRTLPRSSTRRHCRLGRPGSTGRHPDIPSLTGSRAHRKPDLPGSTSSRRMNPQAHSRRPHTPPLRSSTSRRRRSGRRCNSPFRRDWHSRPNPNWSPTRCLSRSPTRRSNWSSSCRPSPLRAPCKRRTGKPGRRSSRRLSRKPARRHGRRSRPSCFRKPRSTPRRPRARGFSSSRSPQTFDYPPGSQSPAYPLRPFVTTRQVVSWAPTWQVP